MQGQLDTLILAILRDGESHGYAIIAALRERTGNELDLPGGSVYPALRRLERKGLIRGEWREVGHRQRRHYALTAPGRAALKERKREWLRLSAVMTEVLGT